MRVAMERSPTPYSRGNFSTATASSDAPRAMSPDHVGPAAPTSTPGRGGGYIEPVHIRGVPLAVPAPNTDNEHQSPAPPRRLPLSLRHMALVGHLLMLAGFLLPWATGAGPFATRDFTGPQLASLARNSDLLISHAAAGPVAFALVAGIYAVPVAAVTGALLLGGATWTSNATAARRAAALCGILALLLALSTTLALQIGPGAGRYLDRLPGPGLVAALLGAALSLLSLRGR